MVQSNPDFNAAEDKNSANMIHLEKFVLLIVNVEVERCEMDKRLYM
ncbi:hypothetical protein [Bacillus wiedmannii]|nr:hypothetical protein [Bacillus wiedmannii]